MVNRTAARGLSSTFDVGFRAPIRGLSSTYPWGFEHHHPYVNPYGSKAEGLRYILYGYTFLIAGENSFRLS